MRDQTAACMNGVVVVVLEIMMMMVASARKMYYRASGSDGGSIRRVEYCSMLANDRPTITEPTRCAGAA